MTGCPPLSGRGSRMSSSRPSIPFLTATGASGGCSSPSCFAMRACSASRSSISAFIFKQHRSAYYDLLNRVRLTGDWEEWLAFFLEGVQVTAEGAVATSCRLVETFAADRAAIEEKAGRRAGSALRVLGALKMRPVLSLAKVCNRSGLSFPAAASAMQVLAGQGIVRELTGRPRNRLFCYDRYLSILAEGTETP